MIAPIIITVLLILYYVVYFGILRWILGIIPLVFSILLVRICIERINEIRKGEEAETLGADAVVNIRYASSAIMQGAAEVSAYATAVKFINK